MIVTTTPTVEGKTITEYLGVVYARSDEPSGRRIAGDKMGIDGALKAVASRAQEKGADAVVGVQFVGPAAHYYDTIHVYGTAVKLK